MRRKKNPPAENHERWLVSYADFITLLFAFFVVMFATSQTDKSKASQVSESVKAALKEGSFSATVASILGGTVEDHGAGNAQMKGPGGAKTIAEEPKKEREIVDLLPTLELLSQELRKEIETGKVRVSMEERGLTISFKQAAAFPSGEDEISPAAYDSVGKVAAAMDKIPNPARLEGHTDALPIHNARFRSNWELSAARSIAMLELLSGRFRVARDRFSIGGYAETAPIDSNADEASRARNRRVDIVILNKRGVAGEPSSHLVERPALPGPQSAP